MPRKDRLKAISIVGFKNVLALERAGFVIVNKLTIKSLKDEIRKLNKKVHYLERFREKILRILSPSV